MTELKPCPFCGGKAKLVLIDGWDPWLAYVECPHCDTRGPDVWQVDDKKFKATAVKKWNRRVKE